MNTENQPLPIYIIGAGIAGISCAQQLQQAGHLVKVIEARDRIGGRIFSSPFNTHTFDLGASWIHGIVDNPIYEICKQFNIHTEVLNYDQSQYFHPNGQKFSTEETLEFERYYLTVAELLTKDKNRSAFVSLQQIIHIIDYTDTLLNKDQLKQLLLSFFERVANDPFATDLDHLISNYHDYEGYYAGSEVVFPNGYGQVVNQLGKDLDIQYQTAIQTIRYTSDGVELIDQHGQVYLGSHAIVAVPLGVLKQKQIHFQPSLASDYLEAIEQMGFGSFNKVFFELEQPLACFENKSKDLIISSYYWVDDQVFNVLNLSKIYQQPTYLMLFGGSMSAWIDHASDHDVWQMITNSVKHLHTLPIQPKQLIITRWGSDPWSHGSFSFPSLQYSHALHDVFKRPIENRLFFAGEHCHPQYAGTVHGAYLSGRHTAEALMHTTTSQSDI